MKDIRFQITADSSVGMYDKETKDILHSITGALKESYDKFINPTNFLECCSENKNIFVADICYGIGYNTKSALYSLSRNNIACNISIDAFDINKELAFISPFIKDGIEEPDIDLYLLSYFIHNFKEYGNFILNYFEIENNNKTIFFRDDIRLVFESYYKNTNEYSFQDDLYGFLHNIYYSL